MNNQSLEPTNKSNKKKILIWAAIAIASIWLYYLTVPGLLAYGLYKLILKYTGDGKKIRKGFIAGGAVLVPIYIFGLIVQTGPEPTLVITEPTNNTLTEAQQITIKGSYEPADLTVTMNGRAIPAANGSFETTYVLQKGENIIAFKAKNWKKTTAQELTITREETTAEKEARLKAEEEQAARLVEEQAAQQAKQAEEDANKRKEQAKADKIAAEEAKKQEAEQAAFDNSKAGQLCKAHPTWSKENCQSILDHKYWIGMEYDMLVASFGKPNSINPSNYGRGTSYQYCYDNWTPSCFYDKNDDGIIDAFN